MERTGAPLPTAGSGVPGVKTAQASVNSSVVFPDESNIDVWPWEKIAGNAIICLTAFCLANKKGKLDSALLELG